MRTNSTINHSNSVSEYSVQSIMDVKIDKTGGEVQVSGRAHK